MFFSPFWDSKKSALLDQAHCMHHLSHVPHTNELCSKAHGTTPALFGHLPPSTHALTCSSGLPCHSAALLTQPRLHHSSLGRLLNGQPTHPAPHAKHLSPSIDASTPNLVCNYTLARPL